jgi:uncharacterized protein (DUF2147 family)
MTVNTKADSEGKMRCISTSYQKNQKSHKQISIAALVISITMFSAIITLAAMASDSFAQGANNNTTASTNKTDTTSGNVTAQVVPQGTSLNTSNKTTATSSNANQGTAAAASSLNCQSIASTIGGITVPNPNRVCDVLIPRQAPTIIGPGNMNMNKFSTVNSIVEVAPISDLMIKSNASSSAAAGGASSSSNINPQKVFVMGEFSLLDPQLVTMIKSAVGSNWTIAAVHNHMVLEKPKMMFVHWSAEGDLNTITNQIKNVLSIVGKVPSSSGR